MRLVEEEVKVEEQRTGSGVPMWHVASNIDFPR
jgi:hypothetical protein